jgi:chromosome segregation ATPase
LTNIYSAINKEISNILQDINFKAYHDKFLPLKENKNNSINIENNINIEQIFVNSFNKLIEFLDELKYDYIQTKQENLNNIKEKAMDAMKILKNETEQNMNENEIEEYKQKIDQLLNDNKILKDQIEINNRKNQLKEINDNNNVLKYEDLEKQIADLKEKNEDLQLKLNIMNEGNLDMDNKYNILENENDKLKSYENMLKDLKEKYDNLTFDYQRIQKENNSLKSIINNQ